MKYIFIPLLLLAFSLSGCQSEVAMSRENQEIAATRKLLKDNHIRLKKVYKSVYKFGGLDTVNRVLTEQEEYNRDGYLVKSCRYSSANFENDYTSEFSYNESGDNIKVVRKNEGGKIEYITQRRYTESHDAIEELQYDEGGELSFKYVFEYDERHNLVKMVCYGHDGKIVYSDLYKYDSDGNETLRLRYDEKGAMSGKRVRAMGNDTTENYKLYGEKGNLIETLTYTENKKGLLMKITSVSFPESKYILKYTYDERGVLIRETVAGASGEPKIYQKIEWEEFE